MMKNILLKRLIPAVFLGILSACTATKDTTRFYTLKPAEIKSPLANNKEQTRSVTIESLTIPRLIDRPQIISRVGTNEIKRAEYHQWGGSIVEEIEHLILDTLSTELSGSELYLLPSESRTQPDYNLHLTINRLNGELGKEAHIELNWLLESEHSGDIEQQGKINDAILLTSNKYSHYVQALQVLIINSVEQLSEELKDR